MRHLILTRRKRVCTQRAKDNDTRGSAAEHGISVEERQHHPECLRYLNTSVTNTLPRHCHFILNHTCRGQGTQTTSIVFHIILLACIRSLSHDGNLIEDLLLEGTELAARLW